MKKINLLNIFCILSCAYSAFFAIVLGINIIASIGTTDFPMIFVWGFGVYISLIVSSICLMSKNYIFSNIMPYIFLALALFYELWVSRNGILFVLNGLIYAIWSILLFNRNKAKIINIACIFTIIAIIYKIVLIELAVLIPVQSEILLSGISFDIAMLIYFYSETSEQCDVMDNILNEIPVATYVITAEDVTKELQFLEFQLEKKYISEEEYQVQRAELLVKIAKI